MLVIGVMGVFVESGEHQSKRSDTWLCSVIRYTNNRRKLGQRRGSKPLGNPASARKEAVAQPSTINTRDQLTPVEQRAFDILKGARRKSDEHPIERQAIQLIKAVEDEWFRRRQKGRPKGKWTRKPDAEAPSFEALKPPLTLTDVVAIATPVIEEFAGKITRRSNAFTALCHIVCAYSEVITRDTPVRKLSIKRKYLGNAETVATTSGQRDENALPYAVQEALSRVRRTMKNPPPDLMRIEVSIPGF